MKYNEEILATSWQKQQKSDKCLKNMTNHSYNSNQWAQHTMYTILSEGWDGTKYTHIHVSQALDIIYTG